VTRALLALALASLFVPAGALAQKKHKPAAHAAASSKKASAAAAASAPKERAPSPAASAESTASDGEGGGDDASDDKPQAPSPTAGKKVTSKTYTFGAMDVEGKLKTPQLLYFLNRVKLELDMSAPDKRSFMKELQQSADDKNL